MPASRGKSKAVFLKTLLVILGITLFHLGFSIGVLRLVQHRLGLQVSGTFWPIPWTGSFYSSDAKIIWKNRVTLLSGHVKIDYNAARWMIENVIRIKISGKNMHAVLAGDWAKMQGVEAIQIDSFYADVDIAKKGLGEIYLVSADSRSFQFHIKKSGS